MGGRRRGRETLMCMRNMYQLPLSPPTSYLAGTRVSALTWNGSRKLLVCRTTPNPLSHTNGGGVWGCDPFWINCHVRSGSLLIYSFAYRRPKVPAPFIEGTVLFSIELWSDVKGQWTLSVWVYFWAFYRAPLLCVPFYQ